MLESIYFKKIKNLNSKSIIFLDRDGVLNKDTGYIDNISRVEILYENIDFIRQLVLKKDFTNPIFVIVSNQSGIARGLLTLEKAFEIMDFITKQLSEILPISAYYFAPFHEIEKNKFLEPHKADYYRKPNPGMLIRAFNDFFSSPSTSFLFGDRFTDKQAAISAGISDQNIHIFTN